MTMTTKMTMKNPRTPMPGTMMVSWIEFVVA